MTIKTVNLHHKVEFLPSMVRTIAINLCSSDLSREWRRENDVEEPIKFGECFYVDLLHEDHVRIIDQLMILEYKHRKAEGLEVDFKDAGMSIEEFTQQLHYTNKPLK